MSSALHVVLCIRHIKVKPDTFTAQLRCHALFGLGIAYVLDLYVQDILNEVLAQLFIPQHFLKQKIVGDCHRVPVNFFIQILTWLSDRHDSSAYIFYHTLKANSMKF